MSQAVGWLFFCCESVPEDTACTRLAERAGLAKSLRPPRAVFVNFSTRVEQTFNNLPMETNSPWAMNECATVYGTYCVPGRYARLAVRYDVCLWVLPTRRLANADAHPHFRSRLVHHSDAFHFCTRSGGRGHSQTGKRRHRDRVFSWQKIPGDRSRDGGHAYLGRFDRQEIGNPAGTKGEADASGVC